MNRLEAKIGRAVAATALDQSWRVWRMKDRVGFEDGGGGVAAAALSDDGFRRVRSVVVWKRQ